MAKDPMKSLAAMLHSGASKNKNKGMDDSIPAMIDGQAPAAISQGEYIIPADVVSMLGDGNTDAGAEILDAMIAEIRKQKTGTNKQADPIADGLKTLLGK